ncbi:MULTISPECIES: YbaN family protein [Pontibacillus]|uniref:YbaN family protein n=1 Tax=Pontibacillus chungwhensis TaxID=265426 RepID=A0ABY8UWQ8_9BACI|nr:MULTISPECIES: YbaN family protein [Pontibacillus]MCD5324210.1 YbaN family protein [Pontibacillus sp. HN14]WIF97733.1 YbaN family protein [Pontibacillus chungwhensis]
MKKLKNLLFALLGILSLGIGIAGTILPVLPGGPFYLFAAFCFSKSSKRVENWFKNTTVYQKYVLAFLQKKGMKKKEKIRINIIADTFIVASLFFVDILLVQILIVALALYKHYYFIYKIETIK